MENKNLETEIRKFNNKGYNNQKAILWFIDNQHIKEAFVIYAKRLLQIIMF